MCEIIDCYGHVSLPRFISVDEFLRAMDANKISKAIIATAETCPDIPELSRAIVHHPDRFKAVGVPLGNSYAEICDSIHHQAECGFVGIRIQDWMIAQYPELLELFTEFNLIPFVVGGPGRQVAAKHLVEFLYEGNHRVVVAPHFGGRMAPEILTDPGEIQRLFDHPRFFVIFSRQGEHDPDLIRVWATTLVKRLGWKRILYGSEFPVCMWRNESYQETIDWIHTLDLQPREEDLDNFYINTAERLFWCSNDKPTRLADTRWSGKYWAKPGKIHLMDDPFIEISEEKHHQLLIEYLDKGAGNHFMDYHSYLTWKTQEEGKTNNPQ